MKRLYIYIIISFLYITCYSQIVTDGYQIYKYPNGTISSEGLLRDGKPDGYWKSYYVTGVLKSEGKRTNFLLDSLWIFYDQVGDTVEKINYLYGKKNGYYYKYEKDPRKGVYLSSVELYAGDKKEGVSYFYYPDGKLKQTIPYNDGKRDGLAKEYDEDGVVITLSEYRNDRQLTRERINRTDRNGIKQGVWKEFYPTGTVKSEANYKDNLLNGYYREYDVNGKNIFTQLYDNGTLIEAKTDDTEEIVIQNMYDSNNRLIYSGPYRNNVKVGIHREYDEKGNVVKASTYNDSGLLLSEGVVDDNGNRNGSWKDFYPDVSIKAEGQYSNNYQSGVWKYYTVSGKLEQTGSYYNGRPDGTWKWFYEDGSLLREEEYYRGQRDGIYTEYSEDGKEIVKGEYSDGEKNKFWKFDSGDYIEQGDYIIGLKDGIWSSYYPNGKLRYKGNYIQGNADGSHLYYYETGKLKEERYYKMGIKQKIWRKYDEEGNVILYITYKDDVEVNINGVKISLPQGDN
ncbi:MAG: toxin-antitoxin system YwqK family antitoxin [Bacteroidales bacterium]|nr:toxin-antitoxin system YwqK family antitoxin [Bacteroidales bacterium]